ncbi:MAG: hypothetical protein AB7N65_22110 [Vicinamibacterales bacterium]
MNDAERIARLTERDRELNSFAFRSFRDVADADYISARMAYRAQLPVQFLWASQQTLEKYLKCILFIRRVPAIQVNHDLRRALALVESAQIPLDIATRSRKFIQEIDEVGRYRYLEASFFVDWHNIVALDQAAWELRRFCTLDPAATSQRLVDGRWAPRVRIAGGYLEKVIANRRNPARQPLLWHNGYFGRGRRTVTVRGGFIGVNSPLLRRTEELIDEILKYAYVPKDVVRAYREHARKERESAVRK